MLTTIFMRLKVILVGFILLHAFYQSALSQYNEILFHKVTKENGEPLGKITGITQDPQGYMWFSGQSASCLYRYDGVKVKAFRPDKLNENSLGGSDLETVYADQNGIIWIGFISRGLDRFDPGTSTFTHYRHQPNNPNSLSDDIVNVILRDRRGRLWIGTNNGLDRLDETSGEFVHFKNKPGNPKSLSDNVVRAIYEDSQGTIWVGTGFPFYNANPESGGLNRLENDGTFTRFMHDPTNSRSLINNKVRSILEDSRGVFWIGTAGDGLHTMDRKTGLFERHTYDPADPEKLSSPPKNRTLTYISDNQITFIKEDRLGCIWIGTMLGGISRYDPITKKRINHFEANQGFSDTSGWAMYQSRDGTMWLSTEQNNFYRIEFQTKKVNDIDLGVRAQRFLEDKNGLLWVGTASGLLLLDQKRKLVKRFDLDSLNFVLALHQNHEDTLWIGSGTGIGIFNLKTRKFSRFRPIRDFPGPNYKSENSGSILNIIQDHLGYMWATTFNGLLRFKPNGDSIKWYRVDEKKAGSLSSNEIITVMEDKSGYIWAGTNAGLNRLDRSTDQFNKYLVAAFSTELFIDHQGTRWVGTYNGLYKSQGSSDTYLPFGDGTVLKESQIIGMVEDSAKNLWVTTPFTITKITAQRDVMFTYDSKFGINSIFPGTIYLTTKGEILLGHDSGFYSFRPGNFDTDGQPFNVLISDILINTFPLKSNEDSDSIRFTITDGKDGLLELRHNLNNLVFNNSSDDYQAPEIIQYFTMLEGHDNVWRKATTDRTTSFFNVPPGKYVYRVKAYNAFGSKAEKQIHIHITPPWWKTWWAYSFYCLCGIGLLWLGRREIIKRERLRSAFELEHLELAKAKEVDKVKSAFFTNISHEFRTPLTLIKGPAQNLLDELSDRPRLKKQAKLIQHNADVLLKHINQLLDLAKLEAGTVKVNAMKGDLNSFLSMIIDPFISHSKQKEIDFIYKLPDIQYNISFDQDKLEIIITNLLGNAVKFTPAHGHVGLDALVDIDSTSAGQLVITITDTGIGIPVEDQTKIFERFYQVNEGGAHKEAGTGIGLALVKELTELLGGSVRVKSESGKGSEFCVTLPVQIISVVSHAESLEQLEVAESYLQIDGDDNIGESNGKTKLLVVEDNAELRSFIISSLKGDYSFCEAGDGKTALEIALHEIPDLIISDVMMPEMDGITMTSKLKKDIRTSHIPIILLTAKATDEAKITGLNTGADDYLTKPFNNNELILKVRNMIASRNRVREKVRLEFMSGAPTIEAISADEKLLQKVKEAIINRLSDEQLSVDSLAEEIGLSRAHFYRKITALTGLPVNELIASFRLERAAQLLAQQWGPVSQVAYEVGFSNPSYFSKRFKEKFGVSPSEYPLKNQVH
jgi:signal transduction histidine kinase/ligand-binding sensor domain-containing protein/DNA-binding response OmpR family regulator